MSRTYEQLEPVISALDERIKKTGDEISELKEDLSACFDAENRLNNRLALDSFGSFSNSKLNVNVENGIISISDNNFGASVYFELKNQISKITNWASVSKNLTLLANHTYRLRTIPVSGTFAAVDIRCAICSGETNPDYYVTAGGTDIKFSYNADTDASLVLYIKYETTADVVFQYALEDITEIVEIDNRTQVNSLSADVNNIDNIILADDKVNNRIAYDAYGTYSNAKVNVSVKDGVIHVSDDNYGNSTILELQKPINRISNIASVTKDITLLAGHTYRLRAIPLSGTFPSNNTLRIGVASGETVEDYSVHIGEAEKIFSYNEDTDVSLILYVRYSITVDVVFRYTLEDITNTDYRIDTAISRPMEITAYFGTGLIPSVDNIRGNSITLTFQDVNLMIHDAKINPNPVTFSRSDILAAASAYPSLTVDTTNYTIRGAEFRFYYNVDTRQIGFKNPYTKWDTSEVNLYTHMYGSHNSGIIYDSIVNSITFDNMDDIAEMQGESVPEYYQTQIETVAGNYREDIEKAGRNGDSFVFITDVHWEGNWKHSPSLINYLVKNENLNMVICGGDIIDGSETYYERSAEYLRLVVDKFKNTGALVITAKGNHDKNGAYQQWSSSVHFSEEKYFGLVQKPSAMNGQIYGGDCYFYYDKASTKTRYIVLDSKTNADATYDITTEQLTWIGGIIDNTPADYHIVVVVHSMGGYQSTSVPVETGVNDFVFKTGATALKTLLDSKLASHEIVALFFGHTHYDDVLYTDGGIPLISTNSDAKWQYYGMTDPIDGTIDAQCFDVVTMDYTAKKIYMRRVGRGSDRTITY